MPKKLHLILLLVIFISNIQAKDISNNYSVVVCSVKNIENANSFIKNYLDDKNSIFIIHKKSRYLVSYGKFNNKKDALLFKNRLNKDIKALSPYVKRLEQSNIKTEITPKNYNYSLAISNCNTLDSSMAFIKDNIRNKKAKVTIYKLNNKFITTYGEFNTKDESFIFRESLPNKLRKQNPYPIAINNTLLNKDNIVDLNKKPIFIKKLVEKKLLIKKSIDTPKKVTNKIEQNLDYTLSYDDGYLIRDVDNSIVEEEYVSNKSTKYFIGVNYFDSKVTSSESGTINIGATTYDISNSTLNTNSLGLKFGIIDDFSRYSISILKQSKESTIDYNAMRIGYDYLFISDYSYIPYLGIGLGKGKLSSELFGDADVNEYILQAGMIINLLSSIDVEIGMEYSKLSSSTSITNGTGTYLGDSFTNLNATSEQENTTSISLGINYKF